MRFLRGPTNTISGLMYLSMRPIIKIRWSILRLVPLTRYLLRKAVRSALMNLIISMTIYPKRQRKLCGGPQELNLLHGLCGAMDKATSRPQASTPISIKATRMEWVTLRLASTPSLTLLSYLHRSTQTRIAQASPIRTLVMTADADLGTNIWPIIQVGPHFKTPTLTRPQH